MIDITAKEVLDFLGKEKPIFYREDTLNEVIEKVNSVITPKFVIETFTPFFKDNGTTISKITFKGKSLYEHLNGTNEVALFCATLGEGLDRLIEEYKYTNLEANYLSDLCGLILIEKLCDKIEENIKKDRKTTARFSIGFNDTDITQQADFLAILNATKKIGVNVTKGSMMKPTKSVTAIIGIYE